MRRCEFVTVPAMEVEVSSNPDETIAMESSSSSGLSSLDNDVMDEEKEEEETEVTDQPNNTSWIW